MSCQFLRLMVEIWLSLQVEGCIRPLSSGAISTQYLFIEKLSLSKTASYNHHKSLFLTSLFFMQKTDLSCLNWSLTDGCFGRWIICNKFVLENEFTGAEGTAITASGSSNEILVNCTGHLPLFALLMSALKSLTQALYELYWLRERKNIFHCGCNGLRSNDSWQRIAFYLCDHLCVVPFDRWRNCKNIGLGMWNNRALILSKRGVVPC